MKYIKTVLCFILILILTSCTRIEKMNIHEFIKQLNKQSDYNINYDNLSLSKTEMMTYSFIMNECVLICIYSDSNGEILRCTVTAEKKEDSFTEICKHITSVMLNTEPSEVSELLAKVFKIGSAEESMHSLIFLTNDIGITFIISSQDDNLCDITVPTLKRPVEEEDISRPAVIPEATTIAE